MENPFPGGRLFIRQALQHQGMPLVAAEVALNSLSVSSVKQYSSCLKNWWNFCTSHHINPFEKSVSNSVSCLSFYFNKGNSYQSLNALRSALSLIMGPEIGSNPMIKRFLKGVYKTKPPRPRYRFTWDPAIVLKYIDALGPNAQLSLELLSKKLLTLLALTTAHRVQTFSLINTTNVLSSQNEIQILIPDLIKTSNPDNYQPVLRLPFYEKNVNICVATTLLYYIKRTEQIRSNNTLFLSYKKPFKKVSCQSLSRWIKETLLKSGIDTQMFKAHSTRHASTSAANKAGVSLDEIRKTAGWSESSLTFAKFYNRQLANSNCFAETILNLTN